MSKVRGLFPSAQVIDPIVLNDANPPIRHTVCSFIFLRAGVYSFSAVQEMIVELAKAAARKAIQASPLAVHHLSDHL